MAVTHQSWEWSNINNVDESQNPIRAINGTPMTLIANQPYDVFTGSVGNRTTIPPGQKWTIQYFTSQGIAGGAENRGGTIGSSVSYMQYDGVDAIIANKLMDMGVPINLNNVDWYRQQALVENLKSLTQTGGVA